MIKNIIFYFWITNFMLLDLINYQQKRTHFLTAFLYLTVCRSVVSSVIYLIWLEFMSDWRVIHVWALLFMGPSLVSVQPDKPMKDSAHYVLQKTPADTCVKRNWSNITLPNHAGLLLPDGTSMKYYAIMNRTTDYTESCLTSNTLQI